MPEAYGASTQATLLSGLAGPRPYTTEPPSIVHTVRILGPIKSRQAARNVGAASLPTGRAKAKARPRGYRARNGQPARTSRAAACPASQRSRPPVATTPLAA